MVNKIIRIFKLFFYGVCAFLGVLFIFLAINSLVYSPEYVLRLLQWQESDVNDYLYIFPLRRLEAAPITFNFDEALEEERVSELFEHILEVEDFAAFF